jgi:hypothetical protein
MAQWSRPVAIPNQTSKTSSALALIQGQLHLIHLGQSSDELWHSTWNGTKWSDNVKINKQSRGRVALAGEGLLVYQSRSPQPDGSYGLVHSLFQGGWSQSRPLPGTHPITDPMTTSDSPAAVLTFGTWTVVRQVPHQDYMMGVSSYRPGFSGSVELIDTGVARELSEGVPALAADASGMHMIYLNKGSNDIWHSGPFGVARAVPNQFSKDSPAAAFHNGELHMVHLGSGSDNIWHSKFLNGAWTPNVRIPDHASNKPPAMASAPDGLHMVHKGAGSDRIWHSIYR